MNTINWNEELDQAMLVEPTYEQWKMLVTCAKSWVTCAVGNLCDIIPRDSTGQPLDIDLANQGEHFFKYVLDGSWKDAKEKLTEIELRSAILINKLN